MVVVFGVGLQRLPRLPFLTLQGEDRVTTLAWFDTLGEVGGADFWMRDLPDHVSVGWAGFASYELELSSSPSRVDVTAEVAREEAAVAFVFSVLPLALPVWGIEPFHGSAVLTSLGALVVLGPSGAGKSSVAAALESDGYPLLADDTCAFDEDLFLWPGPAAVNPRWEDALQAPVGEYNEKTIRAPAAHSGTRVKPAAVVVLDVDDGTSLAIDQPTNEKRMRGILANTRHGSFLLERRQVHQFRVASALGRLPHQSVRLDPSRHGPDAILAAIAPWMKRLGIEAPG
jgi:hypothetical protein